jgi:hypothetical protein
MVEKFEVNKNILIVESKNDKYFIEALIYHLKINIDVNTPICNIDEYECLEGLGNFAKRLTDLKKEIASKGIEKIGILIDADDQGIEERIKFINSQLQKICSDIIFTQINETKHSNELDVDLSCCITHVNGNGELETLLKAIKSEDSTFADCLHSWKECLLASGKEISDKDFDKFWVNNYLRYDTCKKKEQNQRERKCQNEAAIKKPVWNFDHPALTDLKSFLHSLSE